MEGECVEEERCFSRAFGSSSFCFLEEYTKEGNPARRQKKMCRKKLHTEITIITETEILKCCRIAVGGEVNSLHYRISSRPMVAGNAAARRALIFLPKEARFQ